MSVEEEEGWDELDEEVKKNRDLIFVTLDWQEISQDDALGFIQDEAYKGYHVVYKEVWFKGKKALQYIAQK